MFKASIVALGFGLALASAGCGSSSAGSCTNSSGGTVTSCIEYGDGYTATQVMSTCTGLSGTYSTGACVSTNRVGRCNLSASAGGVTASSTSNFYSPTTTADAMKSCSSVNGVGGITATFTAN